MTQEELKHEITLMVETMLILQEGKQFSKDGFIKTIVNYIVENYQPKPTSDVDSVIKYLTSYGHDKLHCPRCGWVEGQAWHCGLCEGHTQNIIDWYATHLSGREVLERFVRFVNNYSGSQATLNYLIGKFLESEGGVLQSASPTANSSRDLLDWATGEDTGASSIALFRYMMGLEPISWGYMAPSDKHDRGRCIRLLKKFPEWLLRLDEMKKFEGWGEQIPLIKQELESEANQPKATSDVDLEGVQSDLKVLYAIATADFFTPPLFNKSEKEVSGLEEGDQE